MNRRRTYFAGILSVCILWGCGKTPAVPDWVTWRETSVTSPSVTAELKDKTVTVLDPEGNLVWTSETSEEVSDILLEDIDRDGGDELILLVWNRSVYGDYHPVYEENRTDEYYQHLYIYDIVEGKPKPRWMSSELRPQIRSWEYDREKETLYIEDPEGERTGWQWVTWGLERTE